MALKFRGWRCHHCRKFSDTQTWEEAAAKGWHTVRKEGTRKTAYECGECDPMKGIQLPATTPNPLPWFLR